MTHLTLDLIVKINLYGCKQYIFKTIITKLTTVVYMYYREER